MKIVNGKLFGQTSNDLDVFQEKIEHRCDRLEISLANKQQHQISTYKEGLEKIYYLQQILGQKIQAVENNQTDCLAENFATIKQCIPSKLLWLTFSSSLTVGLITVFSWLKAAPQDKCQPPHEAIQVSILQVDILPSAEPRDS